MNQVFVIASSFSSIGFMMEDGWDVVKQARFFL